MKIGIFDSGVGGLIIAKAIKKTLPQYEYVYLGDTKRVPYGNRSYETVYQFTREAVDYLFTKEDCALVVLACNTASARALRKLQQEYLPKHFPGRRILGVLIPGAEECAQYSKVGVLATRGTVASGTFVDEIHKINPKTKVYQNPAPMLVPIIEEGQTKYAEIFLKEYLKPLVSKKVEAVVLGCTHYPILKKEIQKLVGKRVKVVSQDEVVPKKLKEYLTRHKVLESNLGKEGSIKILVTDETQTVEDLVRKWFSKNTKPELVKL